MGITEADSAVVKAAQDMRREVDRLNQRIRQLMGE